MALDFQCSQHKNNKMQQMFWGRTKASKGGSTVIFPPLCPLLVPTPAHALKQLPLIFRAQTTMTASQLMLLHLLRTNGKTYKCIPFGELLDFIFLILKTFLFLFLNFGGIANMHSIRSEQLRIHNAVKRMKLNRHVRCWFIIYSTKQNEHISGEM